jgi:hypothetical protein
MADSSQEHDSSQPATRTLTRAQRVRRYGAEAETKRLGEARERDARAVATRNERAHVRAAKARKKDEAAREKTKAGLVF